MKALILFDSLYGNTEKVARAVAAGMGETPGAGGEVAILRIADVTTKRLAGLDLLVVGSPTQRFRATPAVTSLLKAIPQGGLTGVKVAAFDTRMTEQEINQTRILAFFVGIFGYAAEPLTKLMKQKGGTLVVPPEGFLVQGMEGPLVEGELERARAWGREMAGLRRS